MSALDETVELTAHQTSSVLDETVEMGHPPRSSAAHGAASGSEMAVGDSVEIYSKSSQAWLAARVIEVDEPTKTIVASYTSLSGATMEKRILAADARRGGAGSHGGLMPGTYYYWQVDDGGSIGFRNSPDVEDMTAFATAPPDRVVITGAETRMGDEARKTQTETYTIYQLQVFDTEGEDWALEFRFSSFHSLRKKLRKANTAVKSVGFPR